MKRGFSLFAAVLIFGAIMPGPLAAQDSFDLGIKGGLALSKNTWTSGWKSGTLPKPVLGAFLSFNMSKTLAIQPEVFFLIAGGRDVVEDEVIARYDSLQSFIHLPVLAKLRILKEGTLIPVVFAGPAANFLVSTKGRYYEDGVLIYEDTEEEIRDYFGPRNLTFSFVFGGGAEWKFTKNMILVFDLRYAMMLSKFNGEDIGEGSWTIKALMFMMGVGF